MVVPASVTGILGRERELDETTVLLAHTRLLTITGPGGSGKTRLALELAHRLRDRFEDVLWVDLAPVSDPAQIGEQLLGALGLRELPARDAADVVVDRLRDRHVLLVFDNCEHLVEAAARVADTILRNCPGTTILTTTREALGIGGEQTWLVPPLAAPAAMQLFEERARSVVPSFRIDAMTEADVARICARLDGIPLPIELAAARVKVLAVAEIAARLDDAFRLLATGSRTVPRHRTIRETIDWSYRLLSNDEQLLFRRLGVFAGSFSLEEAEAICGDVDVLTLLAALVDKSLVIAEEGRYRFLETVRQFAAEKLAQSGERDALREAHARYFCAFVEGAAVPVFGAGDDDAVRHIDHELANIRAAFDWCEEDRSHPHVDSRLGSALLWYWFVRGHFHEARRRLGSGTVAAGFAAAWQADWSAIPDIEPFDAQSWTLRGIRLAFAEGDHDAAQAAFASARRTGDALDLVLYWSALAAQLRGDWPAARAALEEAQKIAAHGHPATALGFVALHEGHRDEAFDCFRRALALHLERDDRWGVTQAIEGIGLVLLESGEAETGTRLVAAASAAGLHLGARPARDAAFDDEKNARIAEALGDERLRIVLASGAAMSYESMVALARESLERTTRTAPLVVRALGKLEIVVGGERVDEGARARELLLYLLCHPAGRTKEQIGAALWPDADPQKLRNNFHVTLHRLRKILGGAGWIVVDGDTYALDRRAAVDFDAATFEREATAGLRARDAARLARAVASYRGEFFANAAAGEWVDDWRDRLRDLYARALAALGEARMKSEDFAGAAEAYQRLVELDDLDEDASRKLVTALKKAGDDAGATRAYRRLASALRKELGVKPGFTL